MTEDTFGQPRGPLCGFLPPSGCLPAVDHLAFRPMPRNHFAAPGVETSLIRIKTFAGLPGQSAELAVEIALMRC
ncbi:MAG: hypothetical protein AAF216_13950 [Pseudomonadota bacterium]